LDPAITIATVIAFEDLGDDATHIGIPVRGKEAGSMVKVGVAGQPDCGEQFGQWSFLVGYSNCRMVALMRLPSLM